MSCSKYLQDEEKRFKQFLQEDIRLCSVFMNFENRDNLCWLDAVLSLISHNPTIAFLTNYFPESELCKIQQLYVEVLFVLNDDFSSVRYEDRIEIAKEKLITIQENALNSLKSRMKFKLGAPDSAFCCLLNLLKVDIFMEYYFSTTFNVIHDCKSCGLTVEKTDISKAILTLTNVEVFDPEKPTSISQCPYCKLSNQKLKLVYTSVSPCIIFHFENGAGITDEIPFNFSVNGQTFVLIAIMILDSLQNSTLKHFKTYIRHPSKRNIKNRHFNNSESPEIYDDKWLKCDDLLPRLIKFSCKAPKINLKSVYMYIYQAYDTEGKVITGKTKMNVNHQSFRNYNKKIDLINIDDSD